MSFLSIVLASAALSLNAHGPEDKDCTACPLCAGKDKVADVVEVPVVEAAAYESAAWPKHNRGELYAKNNQGKKLPVAYGSEQWISEKVNTAGKVVVLDFWATWCPPCRTFSPIADRIQKQYKDDVAILAISGQNDPIENVKSYIGEHPVSYAHLYDDSQKVYNALEVRGIPHVVILSTDGVIRWQGFPLGPGFEKALEQVVKADPVIQAKN